MAEIAVPVPRRGFEIDWDYGLVSPELVAPGLSPTDAPSAMPGQNQPATLPDGSQVNALTVLTLLEKLASMLDSVQQKQQRMAEWQVGMENSVKRVQGNITKLSKNHNSTSNMVSKLMDKSLHLSANMKEARQHAAVRTGQVNRLEDNHSKLMNRSPFKVLLFQEEEEIPPTVFVKESERPLDVAEEKGEPSTEKKDQEEIWHTVDLSSDEELARGEEGMDDSDEGKTRESRAKKMKRSSLKKVDSLKKAFTLHNIEKTMNRLVPPDRREKIKKSLSPSHRKTSGKGSVSKGEALTSNEKSIPEEESPAPKEGRLEEFPSGNDPGKMALSEEATEATTPTPDADEPAEAASSEDMGTTEGGTVKKNMKITMASTKITVANTKITMGDDDNAVQPPEEEINLDSE